MKIGVCASPDQAELFARAGFEYLELNVQNDLLPAEDEDAFEAYREQHLSTLPLPTPTAACLLPGSLKVTGPKIDEKAQDQWLERAMRRASQLGMDRLVFGSGGARTIPEGFSREKAMEQLLDFGHRLSAHAQENQVVAVVEPLNQGECNVLNGTQEAADYVEQVNHANVRLLVDAYHWMLEKDTPEVTVANGSLIAHAHIATMANRRPPGVEPCNFQGFFTALADAHYTGRISVEAKWGDDMEKEAATAVQFLHKAIQDAGI